MQYSPNISLVIKVLHRNIYKAGEIGEDGCGTGWNISAWCLGSDECGRLFNVEIRMDTSVYEEALRVYEELASDNMHYIKGLFFLDSNEKYDIITVFNPSYEPVIGDEATFYSKIFNKHKKGRLIYRCEANHQDDSCINLPK